ncbi:putative quinol monooxygenase [Rhodococcus sp. P1Y]|uniref:putative quinol monooxygenase n=1 Tax=Rhodococcus sp. P1Y TaxID=1302308 RepID=UPI000EAEA0DB|nr:antibiotic biosynthesis monooxygenase [Rhodococcus sp. P1Y]AYJ47741.1 antibiotic biosynthesis monooxygenase [Rhodococcus sp. P1Y]
MAIIALLDLKLRADKLADADAVLNRVLADTRAFDGCHGVDVWIDEADETHWIAYERWESAEADAKYREWRAGPGQATELGELLAGAPTLTKFTVSEV